MTGSSFVNFQAVCDLDRVVLCVFGLDRLRDLVDGSVGVVVDEPGEDVVDDLSATHLVGVRRDQRVLRLGAVRRDDGGAVALAGASAAESPRRAAGQRESAGRQQRKDAEANA